MASKFVRVQLDEGSELALSLLMGEGHSQSEAIRTALVEAGSRRTQRAGLAAEVKRLVHDEDDLRETRAVMAHMKEIGIDWPA